jgi:hypothetical protein
MIVTGTVGYQMPAPVYPAKHVCWDCETSWRDMVHGPSACEYCGRLCPKSDSNLLKGTGAQGHERWDGQTFAPRRW